MAVLKIIAFIAAGLSLTAGVYAQNIEWQQVLGGTHSEYLCKLVPTPDYGFLIAGSSFSGESGNKTGEGKGNLDYFLWKMDESGRMEWQKSFGGSANDFLYSATLTKEGGFILGGSSNSPKSGDKKEDGYGNMDFWLLKLSPEGKEEWQKTLGGLGNDQLQIVRQTPDGGYIVGGSSDSSGPEDESINSVKSQDSYGSMDYWVIKLNADGEIEWEKTYGGTFRDELKDIAITGDGYLIGGNSNSGLSGNKLTDNTGQNDFWLIRTDEKGNEIWQKNYGGEGDENLSGILATGNGFLLAGSSARAQKGQKTNNDGGTNGFGNGNLLSEEIYDEQLNLIHKTENHYKFENSFDKSRAGYNISVMGLNEGIPLGYNVNKYFLRSKRQFMDYSIEKNYTDEGVLETRTDYYYNGENKLLKSKETITDSNGKTMESTFFYPPDLIGVEQAPYMQQLTDANRIAEPVYTKTTKGDKHYFEKHLKYGQSQQTGNLLLPIELHTKKGMSSINIETADDRKLSYTKYDTMGNLLEYRTEDGSTVSLIWGYNNQYPIAKIEGVDYESLPTPVIAALINLSNSEQLQPESFYELINSVDGMVTAYTYIPLVGISTITQPNGITSYYQYDELGRLISEKDTDENVLRETHYNFKQ